MEEDVSSKREEPEPRGMNEDTEPRWPALVALLAVGGLYLALPEQLAIGPPWLLLVLVSILLVPTAASHRRGKYQANHILGLGVAGLETCFMVLSLALLVETLPQHNEPPLRLLESATALWLTNVLVFALWYWQLDAGGPHQRDQRVGHPDGAFLFPQMTLGEEGGSAPGWSPGFVDYLFLAFNTSTALSPADTAPLSRWAKGLMMMQAMVSLAIIVLLAAYAVNLL
jgi:hypothetical protein